MKVYRRTQVSSSLLYSIYIHIIIIIVIVYVASSKQRSRLRQAISGDHTKLKKLIQQYNTVSVAAAESNILEDDVLSGQFVWSQLTAAGNVRHICDPA